MLLSGREWAAASTEGLVVYSLDQRVVFDPFELEEEITPGKVRAVLGAGDHARSLLMALRLNEEALLQEVLESTPLHFGQSVSGYPDASFCSALLSCCFLSVFLFVFCCCCLSVFLSFP